MISQLAALTVPASHKSPDFRGEYTVFGLSLPQLCVTVYRGV